MNDGSVEFTKKEEELLRRARYVYRQKNMAPCGLKDVVIESLQTYLDLFERRYGIRDELSREVVYGPQHARAPVTSLDDVASLLVRSGKCYHRGDCCKRTVGVRVTEKEINGIEKLGYKREDFLNGDGQIKATPEGCYFVVIRRDGSSRCRIYGSRPQVCKDYFCNRGPPKGRS